MKLPVVPIMLLTATLLSSCARDPEIVLSGPTMGTTYTVRIVAAPPAVTAARLRETIDDVLASIDRQMSGYRPDSELARFNASTSTEWFEVSAGVVAVIDTASSIAERSGGVLDITVAPLVSLWGFGPGGDAQELPQQSALQAARARVGYLKLHTRTEPPAVRKDIGDLTIDLNAVAPGYAVDLLIQRLAALGIQHCMVDVGGEIRAQGRNHRGAAWRIAVEKPQDATQELNLILELDNKAVATSGEYRHFFVRDGRRYSHTIDPRTAHPVDHDLASVTVVSATALEADGWATALNVLGPDQGYELAARLEIPALFTRWKNGTLQSRSTPQFDAYVAVKP